MAVYAYLRVSTDLQELDNQRLAILKYANEQSIQVGDFISTHVSSRESTSARGLDALFKRFKPGDTLIVSELSRLGRSLGQVIRLVDELIEKRIRFIALKENMILDGKQDIQSKVMVAMFGLFAEIERDLISERTKHGMAAARAKGKQIGRLKGTKVTCRLTGQEKEIRHYLTLRMSRASIAKLLGVPRSTLNGFIASRGLGG